MRPRKGGTLSRAQSSLPRKSKGRNILGLSGARAILRIPEGLALVLKDTYLRLPGTRGQENGQTVHIGGLTAAGPPEFPQKLLEFPCSVHQFSTAF